MTANEYMKKIKDNLDSVEQNLEQIQCNDCISRQAVLDEMMLIPIAPLMVGDGVVYKKGVLEGTIKALPPVTPQPKTGHCKDCKWWKDSDGMYRRGVHAESQCPINRREVMEGMGYCFMFDPQERSDKE